jgi:hypothetical protein
LCVAANAEDARKVFQGTRTGLDDSLVGKEGRYFRNIVPLIDTYHPLPRRATSSVTIGPVQNDRKRGKVRSLFAYGRSFPDTRCTAMKENYAS